MTNVFRQWRLVVITSGSMLLPLVAFATEHWTVRSIVNKLLAEVINPIIVLLFALATAAFIWGIILYVIGGQGSPEKAKTGRSVMLWGIIGMFIMASAWGIVTILCDFFETCGLVGF